LGPDKNVCATNVTLNALTGVDPITTPSLFEWYYNGSTIPIVGATSSTYVATQTGTYKVKGTCNPTSVASQINVVLNQQVYVSIQYPGLVTNNNLCNNLGTVSPLYYYSLTQNPTLLPSPSATAVSSTGTFSATPAGLSINPATGAIDTSTSIPGTYQVVYTTNAVGACLSIVAPVTVVLTANVPQGIIVYSTPICKTSGVQNITSTYQVGGTFQSTVGLTINATSGEITPSTSTAGQYVVSYVYPAFGGCPGFTLTTNIEITNPITANFNYAQTAYCKVVGNASPIFPAGAGAGTFSFYPVGLSMNTSTGVIDTASSASGTYQVVNTIATAGGCAATSNTTTVTVIPVSDIALQYGCKGTQYVIEASPVGGSYNPATATYLWTNPAGQSVTPIVGQNNAIVATTQGIYTVTLTTPNGCESTNSLTTNSVLCVIQKGISPNADGKNDNFDLASLGVKLLEIYNRYGTLVYNLENYTNQWSGQSTSGAELIDGTYFYVIQKTDGTPGITGWIYINRQQ
jgi:gliding motility-associated-like protein